jgi:hypothetical protein
VGGRGRDLCFHSLNLNLCRRRRHPLRGSGSHLVAAPEATAVPARPAQRAAAPPPPCGQLPANWSKVKPASGLCGRSRNEGGALACVVLSSELPPPTPPLSPDPTPTGKRTSETPAAKRLRMDAGPQSLSGKSTPQPPSGKSTPSSG